MAGATKFGTASEVRPLWFSSPIVWRSGSVALVWLLLFLLGSSSWQPRAYLQIHNALQDWRWRIQQQTQPLSDPVLVDIDDVSLKLIGPWPWPRELVAHLIERLQEAGANVIALDIVFPEPKDPAGDSTLQRVLAMPGVVTGMHPALGHASSLQPVACAGHIVPYTEFDGVVRRVAPWLESLPSLGLAALGCHPRYAKQAERLAAFWQNSLKQAPPFAIGSVPVPWLHASDQFPTLSAYRVLSSSLAGEVRGKIVLIGSSAVGLSDRIASPLQSPVAGMQVHASIIAQAQQLGAKSVALFDMRWLPWLWAVVGALALMLLLYLQKSWMAIALWLGLAGGWAGLLWYLPVGQSLQPGLPVVMLACWLLLQTPAEWLAAQAQANRLGRRMRRYLPLPVLQEVLRMQRSGLDPTAPQRKRITVMFADIVGYTTLAEQLTPERLALLTQQLLEVMTQSVLDQQGTLDKYIGDAIMAFWGAPVLQAEQADLACAAACNLQRSLKSWNASKRLQYFPDIAPIAVTIGIHTGDAVVGELGSSQRQTYTAIGDTVNVAQRLQALAADYPGVALLSENCVQACALARTKSLGPLNIRGRKEMQLVCLLLDE